MNKKKVIAWTLLLLWMTMIYVFSDMEGSLSLKLSNKIIVKSAEIKDEITHKDTSQMTEHEKDKSNQSLIKKYNYPIRKSAHIFEYLILSLIMYNLLTQYNVDRKHKYIYSILFCFLYACSDEFHQLFKNRTSKFTDVLIDTFGSTLGQAFVMVKFLINNK